ncbi:MAG: hypothetical protein V5B44_18500 [Candidatus Accumulibacter necessarius]|jgi:hypothetical protein|uniref:hypothetical protein n=1 Tax=Candidatus Accumulibacter necessarius TaxID=2954386 RepID=UPI002FC27513
MAAGVKISPSRLASSRHLVSGAAAADGQRLAFQPFRVSISMRSSAIERAAVA